MSFTEANRTTDMNGRNSAEYAADDSVDIIHIIQERDAYKQETEKLRKIIERQRFIIKSLQEQIARKQSVSGTNTPTAANAEALPDTASHSATGTPRLAPSVESTARAGAERISNGASNALGLSSLSVKTPTKGVTTMRKVSQNSSLGSPLPPVAEGRESLDESSEAANLRPWAKSTRLSEIYADYSARHNSVSPMFKPPSGAWSANGADPQSHQRMRSTSGSSFTESLKASIRRTEWPTEWGAHNESGYASDRSAGGRSASAVGDDSRRPSLATDSQRQQPVPASTQPKHDSAFGHVGGAQTIGAAVADADVERRFDTQIPDPASEQPGVPAGTGQSVPSISRSVSDSSSIAPSTPLPAVPTRLNDSEAGQSPSEVMVLRPVSMAVPQPVANGKHAAAPIQEDSEAWRPEEVDRYEYDVPAAGVDSRAGHSLDATRQQHPMQPMQEQPTQPSASRARVPSPSFGPGPSVEKSVTWEVADEEPATHAAPVPGLASQPSARSVAESSSSQRSDKSSAQALNDAFINQPALTSLENIDVQIKDSRVKIDERGKEVSVYMIDIVFRREVSGFSLHEMIVDAQQPAIVVWTVEKRYSDFAALHSSLRQALSKERSHEKLERLPEKEIFRANAPTKNDRRKQWFEKYLKRALKLDLRDQSALLQFLSTNRTVDAEKSMPILLGHKEGFLVKKGKNFGGWKRRYYVCNANKPVLEYYESPGGSINGSISLAGAVVKTGRAQSRPSAKDSDMIRHAFLIEERPRREGKDPVFHPLWADSERERDEWVMALRYVIVRESEGPERAMREVERFVSYAKRKESGALMIQQFQTSITHEHGARRSIEYNRRREEQRDASAKTASPLSNQAWPATHDDRDASLRPQSFPPGHASGSESDLEPPRPLRLDSARSPVLAATLSTSFSGGFGGESLASQAERMSIHYVPSDISTMESSRSSSHTGGGGGERGGGGRGSYASTADDTTGAAYGFGHGAVAAAALGPVASAADSPLTGTHPSDGCSVPASASVQPQPQAQAQAQPRHPFTKNAVGRIVHEEEAAPELPADTPLVTTDILGIGRQDSAQAGGGGRTREEKKRGRITFMWGKRRAAETSDHPLPDSLSPGTNPYGAAADAPPVPSTPRRLRRGSTSNDVRSVLTRSGPFRGPVFGMPLELAVEHTRIKEHYQLPAVVYRCLEYLDAKKAFMEEGIYRLSGATLTLASLRKEFNASRDYNLLKLSKPPDVHAVANLLKAYLRELPEKVLTARLYQDFVRVAYLPERSDRVHELGCLVSDMPLPNYTLLRALTAHLIRIVQRADVNRMTLRNIGIIFSPSLGIPVHLFNLLMVEFEYIFWVNDSGVPEPRALAPDAFSASVPAGINRLVDPAPDAPPARAAPPTGLRHVASRPELGSDAAPASPWPAQDPAFASATDLPRGYSRYPGFTPAHDPVPARGTGRSNRNSIQYKASAPRDLIFQETAITVPARIVESDGEDDAFLDSDDQLAAPAAPRPWA